MSGRSRAEKPGSVRIIGGQWRGRKLSVIESPGLRPSGDRLRETLFNWLHPHIEGARCADLFAGTGVLGIEAASRGARHVTLMERSVPVAAAIEETLAALGATGVELIRGDSLQWLNSGARAQFDIVFVDPPFGTDLAERTLEALAHSNAIAPGGLVYLESPGERVPQIAPDFVILKQKRLGDVDMRLLQFRLEP